MKINITNAVIAAAGAFFVVGAVAQKPQIKDLGLGAFMAIGLVKQHDTDKKVSDGAKEQSAQWQSISTEVTSLSQSLQDIAQKSVTAADFDIYTRKLDKAIESYHKLERRSSDRDKQFNNIRSTVDKLNHQLKTKKNNNKRSPSLDKKSNNSRTPKITAQLIEQQPTTHVYIDGNNFRCSAYRLDAKIDYRVLKSCLMPKNGKIRLNFYGSACRTFKEFHCQLNRLGYTVKALPKRNHADGTHKTIGDDVSMAIDILDKVRSGDRLILISGDGDFFPVIEKMQQRWVKVTAIASAASVSDLISQKADRFISLEDLLQLIGDNTNCAVA